MSARRVLVTGGSRGIGRALVQKFKNEGWQVAACATSESSFKEKTADLQIACDVSSKDQVEACVQHVKEHFGGLEVLINNAGIAGSNSWDLAASDELWHRIVDVNLNGTYYFCKQALPFLPEKTGRIINIASVLAHRGVPDASAYCAAKHAVLGLTRSLAQYLASRQIPVNAICPGWVKTDMANERWKELNWSESEALESVPMGRVVEPEEVADLAFFLSQPSALSITGQALTLDGGVS